MNHRLGLGALLLAATCAAASGCSRAEDWSDPAYVSDRLDIGDERAFQEFPRLSPEAQAQLVPKLIELYNRGFRRDQAVQALVASGSPAARDVYLAALDGSDSTAALAARGLADLGDRESALAIANRLSRAVEPDAFGGFLDALIRIPTAAAGDVVAEMMMRPAGRIGGIGTVRKGCEFLGMIDQPSDAVADALVYGMVNFIPQPYEDALHDCELAMVRQRALVVPALGRVLNGENLTVINQLRSNRYRAIVGQLRASAVLARIHTDAAAEVINTWFATDQAVPFEELREMATAEQQNWYDQAGQSFTMATQVLAYRGAEEDLATLRRLESLTVPESLLTNFSTWLNLSAGAEFGLRTAVHDALAKRGTDADRETLWGLMGTATVGRGGAAFTVELRKNLLHYLGRTARPGEMARYEAAVAAMPERDRGQFNLQRTYFVLADLCGDDAACYAAKLTDLTPVLQEASMQALLQSYPEGNDPQVIERHEVEAAIGSTARASAIWQMALRLGDQPASGAALVENLAHPSQEARMLIGDALFYLPTVPANLGEAIDTFIASDMENRAPAAREYRHLLRVVKARRG